MANLFNYLTGFGRPPEYRKILVAPVHLRDGLIAEFDRVIEAHRAGIPGRVVMKLNALIDGPIIEAIYRASQAGVKVDLIVRSICGLRPGFAGVSDNVRVISIVGRFLEHARIFAFHSGLGDAECSSGSADMMVRNLDHRVEVMTPVEDPACQRELLDALDLELSDTALAWDLYPDGRWVHAAPARRRGAAQQPGCAHAARRAPLGQRRWRQRSTQSARAAGGGAARDQIITPLRMTRGRISGRHTRPRWHASARRTCCSGRCCCRPRTPAATSPGRRSSSAAA